MPRLADLRTLAPGDTLVLDSTQLLSHSLEELRELMRTCGLSTVGIDKIGAASTAIINYGTIEMGEAN